MPRDYNNPKESTKQDIELYLATKFAKPGMFDYEIAEMFGWNVEVDRYGSKKCAKISRLKKYSYYKERHKEISQQYVDDMLALAIDGMSELLVSENEQSKYKASKYIMDYKGFNAVEKREVKTEQVVFEDDLKEDEDETK